jgi:4-amino-4-deoxy-L-arabinose transferase-like glycosyltransferase
MTIKKRLLSQPLYLILFLGLILRLVSINQSLWLDEATSGYVARDLSFLDILTKFSPGDFHPPLYYLILKLWSLLFGTSELGLRSLSIFAGVASIFILYLIVKELFNKRAAVASALLLATSGLHIYFSQEARMYILASFLVLLSVYYFVKIEKEGRAGDWICFSVFTALSATTHYLTLLMLPVFWIFGFIQKKEFIWFKKLFASHIILFISSLLWLPIFVRQLSVGLQAKGLSPVWWSILGKTSFKEALLVPVKFIIGRIGWDNKYVYGFVVFLLFSFFGFLIYGGVKKWRDKASLKIILLWLTAPYFFALILGFWFSVFSYFRLLFLLPAFYILVALGIDSLEKNIHKITLCLILTINLFLSGYYLASPRFHRENWRDLIGDIGRSGNLDKSAVIFVSYGQKEAFRYYDPAGKIKVDGPALIYNGYDIVWLMRYAQPIFDPDDKVRKDLEQLGYLKTGEHNYNGVPVWKYIK